MTTEQTDQPALTALEAEVRLRGWDKDDDGAWSRPGTTDIVSILTWRDPEGKTHRGRDLNAALTAWAPKDAKRLGWVRSPLGDWTAPDGNVVVWRSDGPPKAERPWTWRRVSPHVTEGGSAPDEPTAVRLALHAWLQSRAVPSPIAVASDASASGAVPPELAERARKAGLGREGTNVTSSGDLGPCWREGRRLRVWAGDPGPWYAEPRGATGLGVSHPTESAALAAWLDSREQAERLPVIVEAERLEAELGAERSKRIAAVDAATGYRLRAETVEAERDAARSSYEEAALDRDALLATLAYRGDCSHDGIGLPGCPTCEGRWSPDVRAAASAFWDANHRGLASFRADMAALRRRLDAALAAQERASRLTHILLDKAIGGGS